MTQKGGKTATLNRFLAAASDRWDIEDIRPTIERIAEVVWQVEQFKLTPADEPAFSITPALEEHWRNKRVRE